jgi:hypothetical protein
MDNEHADTLVQEITDLLMEKGCTVNLPAMLDLAIYIIERERKAMQSIVVEI